MMLNSDRMQVSLRVPVDVVSRFDRIAGVLERDRTWVMLRAFSQYLEAEGLQLLEEAEGIAQLDRGEGESLEQVLKNAHAIVDEVEARIAAAAK